MIAVSVQLEPVPAMTGTRLFTLSIANLIVFKFNYAYIGRKQKKRDFRALWITRISAQAKVNGMNYSTLMHGLKVAGIDLNRKMLSEIAVSDKEAFAALCETAKAAL